MHPLSLLTVAITASVALGDGLPLLYSGAPLAGLGYSAALPYAAAPLATATSQSHAQDELGQYQFGYNTGTSARKESKTADGVVRGSYSYLGADGLPKKVNYVADALGYRVVGTNVPFAAY